VRRRQRRLSFSFDEELEQEWDWTERYPTQPELLKYFNLVAPRHDLRRDIQLSTAVTAVTYNEAENNWAVSTDDGQTHTAKFVITAAGCPSIVNRPDFPGLDSFGATGTTPLGGRRAMSI
jgi:cyclohexanone monooxygenase